MNDLNISDLQAKTKKPSTSKPKIATPETAEALKNKMAEIEAKTLEKITETKANKMGLPYINLKGFPVSPEAIALISQDQSDSLKVVCFFYTGSELRLGALNPQNPQIKKLAKEMANQYHTQADIYLISQPSFDLAFDLYKKIPKIKKITYGVEITEEDIKKFEGELESFEQLKKKVNEVNISDLVILVIAASLKTSSSDIHIEAEEKEIVIRFRIDGVLHVVATLPPKNWGKIVARIKLISGLKLNITKKPQDGRFTIFLTEDKVDVRVSTLPTAYGESVVMRLLKSSAASLEFEQLGLRGKAYVDLEHEIKRPNGMIITTGPTGSGKTTTLYAILNKLNDPETKIITLEDPVEYKLKGINQSQVDHSKDYTFANGLRSILRQDPDIVMVGEIRDLETAEIAINAALTGHLVVSTIHTNSAAGAIPRFLAMGTKSFLLSPALNSIIGQRLVRKICEKCKVEDKIDNDTMTKILNLLSKIPVKSTERLTEEELHNLKFYKGKGCSECHNLGYKGRIGIYEIMTMTPEVEKIILSGKVSEYDIQELAVNNGMLTMVQDGLLKAKDGITSVEVVFKVSE